MNRDQRKQEAEEGKERGTLLKEAEWMQQQMKKFCCPEELKDHILACERELEKAVKNKGLERSFKMAVPKDVYESLEKEMEQLG